MPSQPCSATADHNSGSNAVSVAISSRTRLAGHARANRSRADFCNSFCGLESSNSMAKFLGQFHHPLPEDREREVTKPVLVAPGQAQDALGDDVSLHLAGAGFDRVAAGTQIVVR